ncbi:MAG: helix-hairpin-helix domain-containing protein [Dialister invisus]
MYEGLVEALRFGLQFRAAILERMKPEAADEVEQFLASGLISGIGPSMAKRIVQHFGKKTLEIFERNIDALSEVPGIGQKTLERIKDSIQESAPCRK